MTSRFRRHARAVLGAVLVGAAVTGAAALPPSVASATDAPTTVDGVRLNAYEAVLVADINAARAAAGLPRLVVAAGTTDVARTWTWRMARAQAISHNRNLGVDLSRHGSAYWRAGAENVGVSGADTPGVLFDAYMASPGHRANILDPQLRYLGVGVVERPDGAGVRYAYNTLDFVDQYGGSYGYPRQPAAGMHYDQTVVDATTTLARFGRTFDQRFRTVSAGGVRVGRPVVDTSTGTGALAYRVRQVSSSAGLADLSMREGLDLGRARQLQLQVSVTDPTGRSLPARVYLSTPLVGAVGLGSVRLPTRPGWVTLTIPAAARGFRGELLLRVSNTGLSSLSAASSRRTALVRLYAVRVVT